MHENLRHANLWPRFLAFIVDLLLFCAVLFPITKLIKGTWLMKPTDHRWQHGLLITDPLCLVFLASIVLYFVLLEGLTGVTFGKWLSGLRVVGLKGERPGLVRGLLRNALRIVDGLPAFNILGIILILTSAERARLGDRVAGTRVIHIRGS